MVQIDIVYEGDLHCAAVHGPSSVKLATDAPADNRGRGETFSPTDLVATALGTCIATVMGIRAKDKAYPIEGMRLTVKKSMTTTPPRKIARLDVRVEMPAAAARLDENARRELETVAHTCPVCASLSGSIEVPVEFVWPEA